MKNIFLTKYPAVMAKSMILVSKKTDTGSGV